MWHDLKRKITHRKTKTVYVPVMSFHCMNHLEWSEETFSGDYPDFAVQGYRGCGNSVNVWTGVACYQMSHV